jgi:hypothetical protein
VNIRISVIMGSYWDSDLLSQSLSYFNVRFFCLNVGSACEIG